MDQELRLLFLNIAEESLLDISALKANKLFIGDVFIKAEEDISEMQTALNNSSSFTKRQAQLQLMQGKIADMYTSLNTARAYSYEVAKSCDRGEVTRQDAAACVLYASEQAMNQAVQAVQAMGGAGYLDDSPVSRIMRDAKLMEIGAGTSEIRRMLCGRELMKVTG